MLVALTVTANPGKGLGQNNELGFARVVSGDHGKHQTSPGYSQLWARQQIRAGIGVGSIDGKIMNYIYVQAFA